MFEYRKGERLGGLNPLDERYPSGRIQAKVASPSTWATEIRGKLRVNCVGSAIQESTSNFTLAGNWGAMPVKRAPKQSWNGCLGPTRSSFREKVSWQGRLQ